MKGELKTAQVNLRLEPSLKAAAEEAAKADRRSLTSYIEKLIEDDLRATKQQPVAATGRTNPRSRRVNR
jgi:hypothetical protein